jgi:hypothetical protein
MADYYMMESSAPGRFALNLGKLGSLEHQQTVATDGLKAFLQQMTIKSFHMISLRKPPSTAFCGKSHDSLFN